MLTYRAPLADIEYLTQTVFADERRAALPAAIEACIQDFGPATLQQMAQLAEQVLAPNNQAGDDAGCLFKQGQVTTPESLKTCFRAYTQGGWMGMFAPEAYNGQALPELLVGAISEMITASNHAFSMFPALTMGAIRVLLAHGSEAQKQAYMMPMVEGSWTGTMCLTEPHCGSDLGLIKAKAIPVNEQHYQISGQKIFISTGEHDLTDNIVHLVLARLLDAPAGVKGLSLFLVPKFLVEENQALAPDINNVTCVGIEKKMGIHANPTCTMAFDQSIGFLIGEAGKGLHAMFTMMNNVRLGTALQGVGLSHRSYLTSLAYAQERRQMRALTGAKDKHSEADRLIEHPDVRRMLMTQKAFAEGGRALCHFCALQLDVMQHSTDEAQKQEADALLQLLTPLAKGFLTEMGLESASHAIQVFGGHGYIQENGVEQLYRDGRIATLYEGTTGIQALDMLGRKVLGSQGKVLMAFTKRMHHFCKQQDNEWSTVLAPYCKEWPDMAMKIGMKAMKNPNEAGAAAHDFLMYSGYVSLAFMWAQMATHSSSADDSAFHRSKIKTARFYFDRILPRALAHKASMLASADSLMNVSDEEFACS